MGRVAAELSVEDPGGVVGFGQTPLHACSYGKLSLLTPDIDRVYHAHYEAEGRYCLKNCP